MLERIKLQTNCSKVRQKVISHETTCKKMYIIYTDPSVRVKILILLMILDTCIILYARQQC